MTTAFQANAFQNNAFQIDSGVVTVPPGPPQGGGAGATSVDAWTPEWRRAAHLKRQRKEARAERDTRDIAYIVENILKKPH